LSHPALFVAIAARAFRTCPGAPLFISSIERLSLQS
jgi:hypothetical protein